MQEDVLSTSYGGSEYFLDERTNQGHITSKKMEFYMSDKSLAEHPVYVHGILLIVDEAYYLYHQSIKKQQELVDDPFSEPAVLYSNIEGGLGVFAAYNQLKVFKELK